MAEWIRLLLVGLVAGWLASLLLGRGRRGLFGHLVVGVVGAFLGGWLLTTLGVTVLGGWLGRVLQAVLGAIVLLALLNAIRR